MRCCNNAFNWRGGISDLDVGHFYIRENGCPCGINISAGPYISGSVNSNNLRYSTIISKTNCAGGTQFTAEGDGVAEEFVMTIDGTQFTLAYTNNLEIVLDQDPEAGDVTPFDPRTFNNRTGPYITSISSCGKRLRTKVIVP